MRSSTASSPGCTPNGFLPSQRPFCRRWRNRAARNSATITLFSNCEQWNLSERAREIGSIVQDNPTPELLDELEEYERVACRYSLTLFHDCGIHDLDQWLADFAACDFAYLRHF